METSAPMEAAASWLKVVVGKASPATSVAGGSGRLKTGQDYPGAGNN